MFIKRDSKTKEVTIFGKPIGMVKHLSERFKNYLSWFQFPLILYTAVLSTIQYFPTVLAGHLPEMLIVGTFGFLIFAFVVMYLDFEFVFPSERNFLYKGTIYFEERFDKLEKMICQQKQV